MIYRTTYQNGHEDGQNGHKDGGSSHEGKISHPDVDTDKNADQDTPNINDAAIPLYMYAFLFKL
jgi:hypothetical protein